MSFSYDEMQEWWLNVWQYADYGHRTDDQGYRNQSQILVNTISNVVVEVKTFCELGIGNGRNVHFFHEVFPNWEYMANDINPDIHSVIARYYPDVLDYCSVVIRDTLSYLKECKQADLIFTHGHLMHMPDDVIYEICDLMQKRTNKYIVTYEAFEHLSYAKYKGYRWERDYTDVFTIKPILVTPIIHKKNGYIQMFAIFEKGET